MASDITMPRLSDSMEEGTILKWLVSEGDEVERGQEIAEIETDKANMMYESDASGTVLELVASEGSTVPLGEVIARVGDASEKAEGGRQKAEEKAEGEKAEPEAEEEEEQAPEPKKQAQPSSNGAGERVKASPVARRMAEERGIDLGSIEGSGPGGRVVKADVEPAGDGAPAQEEKEEEEAPAAPEPQAPEPA